MDYFKKLNDLQKKQKEIEVDIEYGDMCDASRIKWLRKAEQLFTKLIDKIIHIVRKEHKNAKQ